MPFRKKVLYYGLMLLLTLLVIEGMARLAYYAAYGPGYGGGPDAPMGITPPPIPDNIHDATEDAGPHKVRHPFYGFVNWSPKNDLNAPLPRQRREDTVVIGLLGGSVAKNVTPYLQEALARWFAANQPSRQPLVIELAGRNARQPQQTLIVAYTLLLGGEFDLIVNLDGFNELIDGAAFQPQAGVFPSFPFQWTRQVSLTKAELLLAGHIAILRREQARRAAARETSPLRWSALFGLVNRWRQERIAAAIIQRNHELAAMASAYTLEKHGPRSWLLAAGETERLQAAARFWYRGSVALHRLAAVAGADYYHFLQPNQYVPGSKPLSPEERELYYKPEEVHGYFAARGYPLLQEFNQDLPGQGINYFDMTGIFVDHPETLYKDDCCHFNPRGDELLAAAMVQRMAPALRRLGGARPAAAVSALTAARRPAEITAGGNRRRRPPDFQVSFQDNGKQLRYVREDCIPGDLDLPFFLHLIPREVADLPPDSREYGFENRDFNFDGVGHGFTHKRCAAQIRLPDYPLTAVRTGQYFPGRRNLWSVELRAPAVLNRLRADHAALSATKPVARDYFGLYATDNRLLYLRESCAAADTTAGFFLHIIPEDVADLPADRRDAGFAHAGFAFTRQGSHFDGKCLAAVPLPDYPIKEIRTGQHIPGQGNLWSVELIAAPDYAQLRADYAALSAANPAALDYFDLYWQDKRLLYLRETCAAGDTAANFFLHIVPEDVADLPADRQAAGFAHAGFAFVRQGGHFDGKCLAAVALPDYPGGIREMRTGQHIPGQGDLWSATIAAP